MVNRIKCALVGTGRRLSGWLTRARRGIAAVLRSGEGRRRLGYYAALALLLVLLGSASYAWRARRESAAPPTVSVASAMRAALKLIGSIRALPTRWLTKAVPQMSAVRSSIALPSIRLFSI